MRMVNMQPSCGRWNHSANGALTVLLLIQRNQKFLSDSILVISGSPSVQPTTGMPTLLAFAFVAFLANLVGTMTIFI